MKQRLGPCPGSRGIIALKLTLSGSHLGLFSSYWRAGASQPSRIYDWHDFSVCTGGCTSYICACAEITWNAYVPCVPLPFERIRGMLAIETGKEWESNRQAREFEGGSVCLQKPPKREKHACPSAVLESRIHAMYILPCFVIIDSVLFFSCMEKSVYISGAHKSKRNQLLQWNTNFPAESYTYSWVAPARQKC